MQNDRTPGPSDTGRATEEDVRRAIRRFRDAHDFCAQLFMTVDATGDHPTGDELDDASEDFRDAEAELARCLRRFNRLPESDTTARAAYLDGGRLYLALRPHEVIEHIDDLGDGDRRAAAVLVLDGVRLRAGAASGPALPGPCGCGWD
jgi:hypothetical protein